MRFAFFSPCFFLESRRFLIADFEGLVFLRGLGSVKAFSSSFLKILMASSLFLSWLLCFSALIKSSPSDVSLDAHFNRNRSFSLSPSTSELATRNLKVTRVSTLFTFCPPGPELREVWNSNSELKSLAMMDLGSKRIFLITSFRGNERSEWLKNLYYLSSFRGRTQDDRRISSSDLGDYSSGYAPFLLRSSTEKEL